MEPTDGRRQVIVGIGGVLLLVSLFLPWAKAGGESATGWQLFTSTDVYLLIAALIAILAPGRRDRRGVRRRRLASAEGRPAVPAAALSR